ncbi:MAG: tetraacyldisaccharide 4'-kinase [Deltaproteobacteria bacterium]|nr:tetraacyldisaccharide 4'-kinase [Deltaproteobacteria bacterium]TLN03516.1 MAG: tetraacyldisaccharide 4'-kinase [bacterium]
MKLPDRYFRELWEGKRIGLVDKLIVALLVPGAFVYSVVLRFRSFLYRRGIMPSFLLDVPVISVGNLSVGGTGKTPFTVLIARLLIDRGKRVVVLSRGYGGAGGSAVRIVSDGSRILLPVAEAGDEPVLLARSVPGLIVVTSSDRYRGGLKAFKRFRPDIFLLDDGFQHLRLRRDLNILLLDAARPFGNGWTLPAGLLREPLSAVRRADLIVYTRADEATECPALEDIPACRSSHRLSGVVSLLGGELTAFSIFAGKKGVACAGIADPGAFFDALALEGLDLTATLAFQDHCFYDRTERAEICRAMKETGADFLITTEKDAVKLAAFPDISQVAYAAVLTLEIIDSGVLEAKIEKLL